jgi:hypothetical protein
MSNLSRELPTGVSASDRGHDVDDPGLGNKIYLAFIPWVLFTLIAQHGTLKAAAVAAVVASGAIALPSIFSRRPKLLEIGAAVTFTGFTIVAFAADPATAHWLARYARALAAALLAVIAFSSLAFSPFTAQYARESVPQRFWSSPQFVRINRRLTLIWALVFAGMVPSHLIAGALDTRQGNLIFNWALPVVLIVWAAKRTAATSGAADQR